MNSPLTIKKHGVIIHEGSPGVTRTNEKEFLASLNPSPEELVAIREHNNQRDEIAKQRGLQLKSGKKLAAKELKSKKFQRRLASPPLPTPEILRNEYPEHVAEALISLLRQRGQLG
jgi:hypothetical protein